MPTNDIALKNSAATASISSPTPTSAQHSSTSGAAAAPSAASTPQPGMDPELSGLIDDLANDLRECAANALGWRIKMGIHLHQFRDGLGKEDWLQLLRSGRLPFSVRRAHSLARIGGHKTLADTRNRHKLPPHSTILNEIAALPPSVVEQALNDGTIHPGTSLVEAKRLVAEHRAKKLAVLDQGSAPKPL